MNLPELFNFNLPAPGHHFRAKKTVGSAYLLWLIQAIEKARKEKRILAVFCSEPSQIEALEISIQWWIKDIQLQIMPDWETLPYDRFSPHKNLIANRVKALTNLASKNCEVVLISMVSAMTRLTPRQYFQGRHFDLKINDPLSPETFNTQLAESGYQHVSQVLSPGEWTVRGGIIDLFPMGAVSPCRIELLDDCIESLRLFDPETQRTIHPIPALTLLPAREFPFDEESINRFRRSFREHYQGNYASHPLYKQVSSGSLFAGAEYFLPWWVEGVSSIFDYLPNNAITVLAPSDTHHNWESACQTFWEQAEEIYTGHRHDPEYPILAPNEIFVTPDEFLQKLSATACISFQEHKDELVQTLPEWLVNPNTKSPPIERLRLWLAQEKTQLVLWTENAGRRNVLEDMFQQQRLPYQTGSWEEAHSSFSQTQETSTIWLVNGPIEEGFISQAREDLPTLAWVSENDLMHKNVKQARERLNNKSGSQRVEQWVRDLSELQVGDPVVHQQYGVGLYQGLVKLDVNTSIASDNSEEDNEFLLLEYSNQEKLYVPVTQLHMIGRYASVGESDVRLHSLRNNDWEKARAKAEKQVRDTAAELLSLYALRESQQGYWMSIPPLILQWFSDEFGFELTPDQESAIIAVCSDMAGKSTIGLPNIADAEVSDGQENIAVALPRKPMDRLVCGDVGFGKTEVAMRAAFIAVASGYQVALLCPTTLLAEQHTQSFQDRFARFADRLQTISIDTVPEKDQEWVLALQTKTFRIAGLSRFRTASEQKTLISDLASGSLDIVIGTHRLLQKDISFHKLGLAVVDEEHRFGVRHKEILKSLRAKAHVLTLTATPIPRTLSLSIEGLRDFSVMTTPPSRRLAVKTMLTPFHNSTIREAVQREFRRGGQVFFLYNEVATIETMRDRLQKLLPSARIAIAHGQMGEWALERVMRDFRHQQFNILLCSTIIENGIDIPNANTILIHKADRFGIAQLHQLRGRVGRSHHQAYCYLLVERPESLTKPAQQRLEAICTSDELGAGFYLAMHDLEIRGAGEWLGENQSGAITQVGFDMYSQMLKSAVNALKNGKAIDLEEPFKHPEEINLHCSALLPNDYCGDIHERLKLYKRLANADSRETIRELRAEIVDRFGLTREGKLPTPVETLLAVHRLRVRARPLGVYKITADADTVQLFFHHQTPLTPKSLIQLLRSHKNWEMKDQDRLRISEATIQPHERVDCVNNVLELIEKVLAEH